MRSRAALMALIGLVLSGCVHTEVTEETYSPVQQKYRHILVCSASDNAEEIRFIENLMSERLGKHHVHAETCRSLLKDRPPPAPEDFLAILRERQFDALLAF